MGCHSEEETTLSLSQYLAIDRGRIFFVQARFVCFIWFIPARRFFGRQDFNQCIGKYFLPTIKLLLAALSE
jgi:hypothetical protein